MTSDKTEFEVVPVQALSSDWRRGQGGEVYKQEMNPFAKTLKLATVMQVRGMRDGVARLIKTEHCAPLMLRLSWADAGTFQGLTLLSLLLSSLELSDTAIYEP